MISLFFDCIINLCVVVLQSEEVAAQMGEYPKEIQSEGGSCLDDERYHWVTAGGRWRRFPTLSRERRRQLDDMKKTLEDKPRITKKDCYRELSMIAKHFPVTADSSLTEYRGAQANYIDYINSLKHGNPDNW